MASSTPLTVIIGSMGPKISSSITESLSCTSVNNVKSMKRPTLSTVSFPPNSVVALVVLQK